MKIVVVGPGAIGCLFAAMLAEAEYDVVLLDKDSRRARRLSAHGVRIDTDNSSKVVPIRAIADPHTAGTAQFVCVCVKSYDTAAAIRHALPLIGAGTAVCSFQNGLGNAERIAARVRPRRVICAATAHGSTYLGTGHIRHAGSGLTVLAPYSPDATPSAEEFARILARSGVQTNLVEDPLSLQWSKLIINAAINPVTAIANVPNGVLPDRPDLWKMSAEAAAEAETLAHRRGIRLLYPDAVAEVRRVCLRTRANLSSMLQDLRRGKRTEIDAINGAVVREARRLNLDVPMNALLCRKIKAKEKRLRSPSPP